MKKVVVTLPVSDKNLADLVDTEVHEVNDPDHPLRVRFFKNRKKATIFLIEYVKGQGKWHRLGYWPTLTIKDIFKRWGDIQQKYLISGRVEFNAFHATGELLNWYLEENGKIKDKSTHRFYNITSVVNKHLKPVFSKVAIADLDREIVKEIFIAPLLREYKAATVSQYFKVFKAAFSAAIQSKQMTKNPLAEIQFSSMVKGKALVKDCALHTHDIDTIFTRMQYMPFEASFLVLTMLCFGFRIGETRQLKLSFIDKDAQAWRIPAPITKTKNAFTSPISEWYLEQLIKYREQQKKLTGYTGTCLFPNTQGNAINKDKANEYVQYISNQEWTAHDLRKLARTYWAEHGVDYFIGELLINHAIKGLDEVYIRTTALQLKRQALNEWHFFLAQKKEKKHLADTKISQLC